MKILLNLLIISFLIFTRQNDVENPRFIIALVGNGLDSLGNSPTAEWPRNRSQAIAMAKGAEAAFFNSPQLEALRKIATLKNFDDGDRDDIASEIARKLQKDPKVLAVIGHGTSSTSIAAGWIYAQSQIPMLMPIATNPRTMRSPADSTTRLRNVFRLPPNDELVQVPAIAYLALKIFHSRNIILIGDYSKGAKVYSSFFLDALPRKLSQANLIKIFEVDNDRPNFAEMSQFGKAQKVDLVVFCGYGTTAINLLEAMRNAYNNVTMENRPKIILSDGCKLEDLNTSGFQCYLTFPSPPASDLNDEPGKDAKVLKELLDSTAEPSYEIYGYDAMLLIAGAAKRCGSRLSRTGLIENLSAREALRGVLFEYYFSGGENRNRMYYVYYSDPAIKRPKHRFKPFVTLTEKQFRRLYDR